MRADSYRCYCSWSSWRLNIWTNTLCVLYNSHWRHIFTEREPNLNKFAQINDIITHNIIAQIKYSNLETEPNVMKKFKRSYQIEVQIRLVRNYEIQIHKKTANPKDLYPNPNPCSSLVGGCPEAHSSTFWNKETNVARFSVTWLAIKTNPMLEELLLRRFLTVPKHIENLLHRFLTKLMRSGSGW